MNYKKTASAIALAGALSLGLAYAGGPDVAPVAPPVDMFSGFFVGVGVNHVNHNGEFRIANEFKLNGSEDLVGAQLELGWARMMNRAYVAAVLYGRWLGGSSDFVEFGGANRLHVENNWTGGLEARVGYAPDANAVVYLSLGAEVADQEVKFDRSNYIPAAAGSRGRDYREFKQDDSQWAFVPGVGVLLALSQNLSVQFAYKLAYYENHTVSFQGRRHRDSLSGGNRRWREIFNLDPRRSIASLSMNYRFASA